MDAEQRLFYLQLVAALRGWEEVVYGTQPAAGANFAATNDSRFESRLLSVTFQLVTDANVANRFVSVDYEDGNGKLFCRCGIQGAVTAGTTARFAFSSQRTISEANVNNDVFAALQPAIVKGGQSVQINVANKQAGDQLSNIVLLFERYLSGQRELRLAMAEADIYG